MRENEDQKNSEYGHIDKYNACLDHNMSHKDHIAINRSSRTKCSTKKVFLQISKNSQGSACARDSFNKVAGLRRFPGVFL